MGIVSTEATKYIAGIPQNNGAYFDGAYYWVFYYDGSNLKCKYGLSLASLVDAGSTGISTIGNTGRMYAVVFGTVSATHYAWCLYDDGTETFGRRRWELTSSGLGSPTDENAAITSKSPGHATITKDYGSAAVSDLYGAIYGVSDNVTSASVANRAVDSAMTTDTGGNSYDPSLMTFMEHAAFFKLSDGFLGFAIDCGNSGEYGAGFGHASEYTKTLAGDTWSVEDILDGNVTGASVGNGDFTDQNWGRDTSHAGQQDLLQLDSGEIYVAYCGDDDTVDANYGQIKLVKRGNAKASTWSLVSNDVIGGNVSAWHISVTTDGTDIWICYVKNASGVRGDAIYSRKYIVSTTTFESEIKIADITAGYTFERMFSCYRSGSIPLLAYSESNDAVNYTMYAARADVSNASTISITATGTPNGTYPTLIFNPVDYSVIHGGDVAYASNAATIPAIPLAVGTAWRGVVFDNEDPNVDGAPITGVTV